MTTPENDRIDEILMLVSNKYSVKGYQEARQAIEQLLIEARIDEVKNLPRAGFIGSGGIRYEATLFTQMDNRITELKKGLDTNHE